MKRFLIYIIMGVFAMQMFAQSEIPQDEKKYRFVYIAHDSDTPVSRLISRLQNYRRDAVAGDEDLIIYLSSGVNPIIVVYNNETQNETEFDDLLLAELNERVSHDVDPETDMERIMELINKYEFIDNNKRLKYESAAFDFYVNPKFWTLNNNESIIAPLYFALDIPHIRGGRVTYSLYESKEDRLPDGDLFGEKNIENINQFTKTYRTQY